MKDFYNRFLDGMKQLNIGKDKIGVIKDLSQNAVNGFPDEFLDFVFIDGDHSYEGCLMDLMLWTPKVRTGGFITGHDTHFPGVVRALDQYFGEGKWKDAKVDYCWYIKKEE